MRVLLAEGEPDERHRLRKVIRGSGHKLISVPDGDAAWRVFESKGPFGCALLDFSMPGLSGLEILRKAAERGCSCERTLFLLTARHFPPDVPPQVRALGGDIFQKPLDSQTLLFRLRPGRQWALPGQSER